MDKYIKREDAYEILHRMFCDRCGDYTYCEVCDIQRTFNLVKAQLYCDVEEVRHGEWIDLGNGEWKCSLCNGEIVADAYGDIHPLHDCGWIGCPYCLAKMDGGGNGNDRP